MNNVRQPDVSDVQRVGDRAVEEVTAILAAGILRLHARSALTAAARPPVIPPNSNSECLEVPAETVLSVHTG